MPLNYNSSNAQVSIQVMAAVGTTTTVQAFGSADGYASPRTQFADDELIAIAGTLIAADGANLTGVLIAITMDGGGAQTTALYGFAGGVNYFQLQLGVLTVGSHTITASFPRTRR